MRMDETVGTTSTVGAALLGAAAVAGGVLAGVYAGFAVGVMPGLAAGGDDVLVATMRQINAVIVNPVFMVLFVGAPLLAIVAAVVRPSIATVAGAVLAVITLAVTAAVNVPLNQALDAAPTGSATALAQARAAFEAPWVRANQLRTLTGVLAAVAPAVELVRHAGRG